MLCFTNFISSPHKECNAKTLWRINGFDRLITHTIALRMRQFWACAELTSGPLQSFIVVSDWNSSINMIQKRRRYVGHAGGRREQHPQWPGHDSQEVIHYWFQSTLWLPDMILTWYWCVGNAWGLQVPHPEPPGRAGWNLIYLIRQDRINLNSC